MAIAEAIGSLLLDWCPQSDSAHDGWYVYSSCPVASEHYRPRADSLLHMHQPDAPSVAVS